MLSEAYGSIHRPTPEHIIEEGINKLSDNGKVVLRQRLHQEGILGAIAGGLLGHAVAPGIGAGLLGAAGIPAVGGAVTGAYLGHKATEDGEDKTGHFSDHDLLDAAEDAGTSGPKLLSRAREELKDGSLDDDTRDALARDVYAHWAHGDPDAKDHLSEEDEELIAELAPLIAESPVAIGQALIRAGAALAPKIGKAAKWLFSPSKKAVASGSKVRKISSIPAVQAGAFEAGTRGIGALGSGPASSSSPGARQEKAAALMEQEEDVSAFALGDIVYGIDGEEVVVDIEQGTVFTMELGRGGNMYGEHPQASPIEELSKIDIDTDFTEDQETGYEARIDELGAEHGFTGSGKGHATD